LRWPFCHFANSVLLASDGGAAATASSDGSAAASSDGENGQGVEIDPSEVMEQY